MGNYVEFCFAFPWWRNEAWITKQLTVDNVPVSIVVHNPRDVRVYGKKSDMMLWKLKLPDFGALKHRP